MALVKNQLHVPAEYSLSQNYPNPFNPETTIHFTIPHTSHVQLSIYNITGELVKKLVDDKKVVGFHSVKWDGTNKQGQASSSGVYIYSMKADGFHATKSMVLLK